MVAETHVELAPAKVNLFLHIQGRRSDGMHLLDSLVAFADYGDVLSVDPATGLTLELAGEFASALAGEADNLVLRAARRLRAELGVDGGAALRLTKNLPLAAGLGGGSADAAAVVRLLSRFWQRPMAEGRLSELALSLGADVPVCLAGRASLMSGIGEVLHDVAPLPPAHLVLVNPGQPLSTPAVFGRYAAEVWGEPVSGGLPWPGEPLPDTEALAAELAMRGNDLQAAAQALVPEITRVIEGLSATDGCLLARMSGSGATCFGLYAASEAASAAAAKVAGDQPKWWVKPAALRA